MKSLLALLLALLTTACGSSSEPGEDCNYMYYDSVSAYGKPDLVREHRYSNGYSSQNYQWIIGKVDLSILETPDGCVVSVLSCQDPTYAKRPACVLSNAR